MIPITLISRRIRLVVGYLLATVVSSNRELHRLFTRRTLSVIGCLRAKAQSTLDRPPRPFTRPRIRPRALPPERQAAAMPNAAIRPEVHQALDVHRRLAAQIAFDRQVGDGAADFCHFRLGEILDHGFRGDAGRLADLLRASTADAVDRPQRDYDVFVQRDVDACYTCHLIDPCSFNPDAACDGRRYRSPARHRCAG